MILIFPAIQALLDLYGAAERHIVLRNVSTGKIKRLTVKTLQENYRAKFQHSQESPGVQSLMRNCTASIITSMMSVELAQNLTDARIDCSRLPDHLRAYIVNAAFLLENRRI